MLVKVLIFNFTTLILHLMDYQLEDKVIYCKSGIVSRVICSADKDPDGNLITEYSFIKDGQFAYSFLTAPPEDFQQVIYTLTLPVDKYILENGQKWLFENTMQDQGVWIIHTFDVEDNFPSDLHAHRKDEAEALDLYTGRIYDTLTMEFKRSLSKKAMNHFYMKMVESIDKEFKKILIEKKAHFTYLK